MLKVIAILGVMLVGGCAAGTDAIRQSCTNARGILAGAAPLVASYAHQDLATQRLTISLDGGLKLKQHEIVFGKAESTLDGSASTLDVLCASADAIDDGEAGNVTDIIAQIGTVVTGITQTIASIKDVL